MYLVTWTDNSGCSDSSTSPDYSKACYEACQHIHYQTAEEGYYTVSATVADKESPDKILYELTSPGIDEREIEHLDYQSIFKEMVCHLDFLIARNHDGFSLVDEQKANLGQIEDDRFETASDMISRLDTYIQDSFYNDLHEETSIYFPETDTSNFTNEDWISFLNIHEEFKYEHFFDYQVCKMLSLDDDKLDEEINLNFLVDIDNYPYTIDSAIPRYEVSSYFGEDFRGLEDNMTTYDWSYVEEYAHEHLCKGGNIEIYEGQTGKTLQIKSDNYHKEMESGDFSEFPYKADYFTESKNKNKNDMGKGLD